MRRRSRRSGASIEARIILVLCKRLWTIGAIAGPATCRGQAEPFVDEVFMQDIGPLAVQNAFPGAFGPGSAPSAALVVLDAFVRWLQPQPGHIHDQRMLDGR